MHSGVHIGVIRSDLGTFHDACLFSTDRLELIVPLCSAVCTRYSLSTHTNQIVVSNLLLTVRGNSCKVLWSETSQVQGLGNSRAIITYLWRN